MNRLIVLGLAATFGAANIAIRNMQGTSVELQPTSPGVAQTGHLNISGTAVSKVVRAETVFGNSTATTGIASGGDFRSASTSGRGFYALASATSGLTYGGFFQNQSSQGRAVYGLATGTSSTNYGGYFQAAGLSARGLLGVASSPSGTTYGVYGTAVSPNGYGVYSDGKMHATGVISGNGSGLTNVNASLLGGQSASAFLTAIPVPLNLTGSGAHILRVQNTGGGGSTAVLGISTAGNGGSGGRFETASEDGYGLLGINTSPSGNISGVYGQSASYEGFGVVGASTSVSGETSGVFGQSASSTGRGVSGLATATSGANFGIHGETRSTTTNAAGVFGLASASTGVTYGVWGQNSSASGYGVVGISESTTGTTFGVFGRSNSPAGYGVHGYATTGTAGLFVTASTEANSAGVKGHATHTNNSTYGVWGQNDGEWGYGVYGNATDAFGAGYGVVGKTVGPNGWSVYAIGNVGASGSKSFRIDHPQDPENKYLLHYAAESPKPQNFYVGNVTTDAKGYAWVELPDYFSEINANFKYQLTVVRDDESPNFVQAQIGKKIKGNRFLIMSSAPKTEVSWRVDADRNDLYVRNRPPKDVVAKEGPEKGTYQHPEFYGLGPERGMNYHPTEPASKSKAPPSRETRRLQK